MDGMERDLSKYHKGTDGFYYEDYVVPDEGGVVQDNCMGSGTTAVAAIRTGRHYIGFEVDPAYCEIAERRIREELERGNGAKQEGKETGCESYPIVCP